MANIVETATSAGTFNTLVEAVQKAGLVETLSGSGPFTVFAPRDEVFDKMDKDKLQHLLDNQEELKRVLSYHVVSGKYEKADMVGVESLPTLQGSDLMIDEATEVMVNTAKIVEADIEADNGVIHVIDTLLEPKELDPSVGSSGIEPSSS